MPSKGRKFNKPRRGGGRHFHRDLVRGKDGIAVSRASLRKNAIAELTRTWAERREPKKKQAAQKQAQKQGIDDADLINPNHIENLKELKMSDLFSAQWSRRDAEKKAAKERYWKLHRAGKTEEAKSDLARLKKIKEEREAAQTKRKAEAEVKAAEAKKKAAMSGKRI